MAVTRADRLRLTYGWGFQTSDFVMYGFESGRPIAEAQRYLGYDWFVNRVRPALNRPASALKTEDKWTFYRLMAGFGLPSPTTLGLYEPVFGVTWDGRRPLRTPADIVREVVAQRPDGLVVKPCGGQQGKQLLVLDAIDYRTGEAVTSAGTATTLEEALNPLSSTAAIGRHPGYIVQARLSSHPDLAELAPWTTNTLRVQTFVASDGTAHVQAAVARLGRKGNMADNWHQGGVNVAVDIGSGVLGSGCLMPQHGGGWTTTHPDSGREFTGRQVPHWAAVVELCRRAAPRFPGLRSLGWDVVVGPEGPVLLEANADWDVQLLQVHSSGFLADDTIREQLVGAGAPMPTGAVLRGIPARPLWRAKRRLGR